MLTSGIGCTPPAALELASYSDSVAGAGGIGNAWESEIYAKGRQINRWPFSDVVADVTRLTAGLDRSKLAVLELGCGTGNNIWFFLDCGFEVCGIDIAPTAIALASDYVRSFGFSEADLRVGDIAGLPWESDSFDFVVDRGVLSQLTLDDVARTITEVFRVLKPGGRFLSYDLFGWNNSGRQFGVEVSPRSYANFSGGRLFGKSPRTTFFDRELISEMWRPLRVVDLVRHQVVKGEAEDVDEYYTVQAVKD